MNLPKTFQSKCVVHCQHCFCIDFTGIWIPKKHDSWIIIGHLNISFAHISPGCLLDRMLNMLSHLDVRIETQGKILRRGRLADSLYLPKKTTDSSSVKNSLRTSLIKTLGFINPLFFKIIIQTCDLGECSN